MGASSRLDLGRSGDSRSHRERIEDWNRTQYPQRFKPQSPKSQPLQCPPDVPKNIHPGAQGKHIPDHNNYIPGRSTITSDPQKLLDGVHSGKYPIQRINPRGQPLVDFGKPIGKHSGTGKPTKYGTVHSGKNGAHIVPANPNQF